MSVHRGFSQKNDGSHSQSVHCSSFENRYWKQCSQFQKANIPLHKSPLPSLPSMSRRCSQPVYHSPQTPLAPRYAPTPWPRLRRSEEHTSELQSLMRISYAVFCLKTKKHHIDTSNINRT